MEEMKKGILNRNNIENVCFVFFWPYFYYKYNTYDFSINRELRKSIIRYIGKDRLC